ncbi:MAG: hypothetical protein KM310_00125 [Clostridiales bacterium]|nr:hypothetical protein [Clostridiales bacterium]
MDAVDRAKYGAVLRAPYLARAVFALRPKRAEGVPVAAVSKTGTLYVSEAFAGLSTAEQVTVIAHEALHLLLLHFERLRNVPIRLANVAGDLEINSILREAGFSFPEGEYRPLFPEDFDLPAGKTAEEYIELLKSRAVELFGSGNDMTPDDDESGGGSDERNNTLPPFGGGSGSHGHPAPWEDPVEAEASSGMSETEWRGLARQVAKEVQAEKARGYVPGALIRWAEGVLRAKVDWQNLLRHFIGRARVVAGVDDYSYTRPPRRRVAGNIVFPAMIRREMTLAVIVDTSGSVEDQQLAQARREVLELARHFGKVTVLDADAAVQQIREVRAGQAASLTFRGGGGTDMALAIEAAAKLRPRPDVIIVLTDGYTPWPDRPLGIATIAVLYRKTMAVPQWIRQVIIDV